MSAENRIVWTPEQGLREQTEVRSIAWNNFLLSDDMFLGQYRTAAEIRVTPETALQSTVVLACCRILAETISAMDINVMRRTPNGGSEIADIPLQKVLSFAPNEWQTKFEFFEQLVMTVALWGNSYSRIRSGRYGAVSALDNLHPSRMDVERLENGRLRYLYTNPETGRIDRFTQDEIMHIRWTPEPDGIKGMVPVEVAREAIALARACEIHASKYWANSARPGVVLQTDNALSPEAAERLRDNWEALHRGSDRAHKTCVLTNGLKIEPLGFSAEQSQFIDSRRFQSEEIARVYRLPISLVQGQSSGDPETNGQEFLTYTLMPWLKRIESGISRSLIWNDDMFFAEFDTRGIMRANSNQRATFYSTMTNLGIYSINDCRRSEGLAPIEHGDKHFVAMNMTPLEDAVKGPQPPPGGPPPEMPGAKPSLPGVALGEAPAEAPKGQASVAKPDDEQRKLSPQNQAMYDAQKGIVKENGLWSQQDAHYQEANPFADRGISCKHCEHFQPAGRCEIVSGHIRRDAVCKLWVIPDELLAFAERRGPEKREADCGRESDGKFGPKNNCASADGSGIAGEGKAENGQPAELANVNAEPPSRVDVERLLEKIAQNPGGFTLDPASAEQPPDGIMVSEYQNDSRRSVKIKASEINQRAGQQKFAEWIADNVDVLLGDSSDRYVGGWSTGDDFYIDVATRFPPEQAEQALEAGRKSGQLAVFNLGTFKETWVKYGEGDSRKPPEWDNAYATARKSAAVSQVYSDDSPDMVDEDHADELAKHGKKSVRAYNPRERETQYADEESTHGIARRSGEDEAIRCAVEPAEDHRGLPIVSEVSGGEGHEGRGDSGQLVVRGFSGAATAPLPRPAGCAAEHQHGVDQAPPSERAGASQGPCRRLIDEAAAIAAIPANEFEVRSGLVSIADFDASSGRVIVSPDAMPLADDGWVSQTNPVLHEAARRVHFLASRRSYERNLGLEFLQEQRSMIERDVSRYAATSGDAFIAEVIAGTLAGKKYGDATLRLFKSLTRHEVPL